MDEQVARDAVGLWAGLGVYVVLLVMFMPSLISVVATPLIASRKGLDGCLWFVMSALWFVLFGGVTIFAWIFGIGGLVLMSDPTNSAPTAPLIVAAVVIVLFELLPLGAVMFAPSRIAKTPSRLPTRRAGRRIGRRAR